MRALHLAENIRRKRKERGWTQQQLANKMFTTRYSIVNWETKNKMPTIQTVVQLCELFDCGADELLFSTED